MSLVYREMSLLNYGTINLHTKIVQKYQLIAVSHSVLVDPVEVLVHPCVDTGKVWLSASRPPRNDPAQLPYLTNNEHHVSKVKLLSNIKEMTDLSDGIEAVQRPSGVALARVPPSLAGAEHRVGDLPVELTVV